MSNRTVVSSNERVKQWRQNTKIKMVEAMGGQCQCCGYDKCIRALAFHHIDPSEKDIGFGEIRSNPKSWNKIVEELRKCILVCHNCHSEIHAGIRDLPDNFSKFNEEYSIAGRVLDFDECPQCRKQKPVNRKYCSHKCSQTNRRKVGGSKT